ncbi:MAG: hypothetical protein ABIK86_01115 [candidate division WOR-3 bacterium]
MRRIVLAVVLVAVVGLAAFMLMRPKKTPTRSARRSSAQSDSAGERSSARSTATAGTRGKTAGRVKATTKQERTAEEKRLRKERRKQLREQRKRERERRRQLRLASRRQGKSGRRTSGRKGQYYVVRAIVSLGGDSYALVDSRRVRVGDVVIGRRIVAIQPDRLEVEAFGKRMSVRVGESLLPPNFTPGSRRGRS